MGIRLQYQRGYFLCSESQFNYLFTLKNAHLSSNGDNFRMQPNIAMKFVVYVARFLLCKYCKFGQKLLQFQRYRIFPTGLLSAHPVYAHFQLRGCSIYWRPKPLNIEPPYANITYRINSIIKVYLINLCFAFLLSFWSFCSQFVDMSDTFFYFF